MKTEYQNSQTTTTKVPNKGKRKEMIIMARIPKCMTHDCPNDGVIAVSIAKRGGRNGYYCERCARERGYSTENAIRYGERKNHGFTFSCELETSHTTEKGRGEMLDFGFIPTYDATVDVEYKSPIYEGLNAVSKQCVSIEKLITNGDMLIGSECGTHFHVGHVDYINGTTMRYLRRFNGSLFVPLSEAIMADPAKAERFFGRRSNHWAEPVTMQDPSGDFDGSMMKHSAMFNLQHNYTIEFRQAKFVSATQYMNVAKFARDCVNAIIENFIKHFNDGYDKIDARRYYRIVNGERKPSKDAYRKHKAQVTAQKMVSLYEKYTHNI